MKERACKGSCRHEGADVSLGQQASNFVLGAGFWVWDVASGETADMIVTHQMKIYEQGNTALHAVLGNFA